MGSNSKYTIWIYQKDYTSRKNAYIFRIPVLCTFILSNWFGSQINAGTQYIMFNMDVN